LIFMSFLWQQVELNTYFLLKQQDRGEHHVFCQFSIKEVYYFFLYESEQHHNSSSMKC